MYPLLRRFFFLFEAEKAHHLAMNILKLFCSIPPVRNLLSKYFLISHRNLQKQLFGLNFRNAVGLGAGFDKNALYLKELDTVGFGFVEIGTVTPKPQAGNDKPRLFRLKKDSALINRMGFNNDGAAVVTERLKKWREKEDRWQEQNQKSEIRNQKLIIGGNIGKNKSTPNEEAWKDYEICFNTLHPFVDFFVVNVSSPNTPGLRELQEKDALRKILIHLQMINNGKAKAKPILLKIAPDLTKDQIDDVIELAEEIKLDGLVATNTTISSAQLKTSADKLKTIGTGGLSGKPLEQRSTEIVNYIHQRTNGSIPVIGSGGIFTPTDALKKIAAGAALVEVWTGFIYEGPFIVRNICKHIANNGKGKWGGRNL
jgi:dihydroorotate dehydrogenase